MSEEYLDVVDENDAVIGNKPRAKIEKSDIYRISSLWIFDKEKKLLIAQRPEWKKHDPGKWTESVVGTVAHGETYESNMIREAEEELGLKLKSIDLIFIAKQFHKSIYGNMFGSMYAVLLNQVSPKIEPNRYEVPNIEWITHDNFIGQCKEKMSRFVGGLESFYNEIWKTVSIQ